MTYGATALADTGVLPVVYSLDFPKPTPGYDLSWGRGAGPYASVGVVLHGAVSSTASLVVCGVQLPIAGSVGPGSVGRLRVYQLAHGATFDPGMDYMITSSTDRDTVMPEELDNNDSDYSRQNVTWLFDYCENFNFPAYDYAITVEPGGSFTSDLNKIGFHSGEEGWGDSLTYDLLNDTWTQDPSLGASVQLLGTVAVDGCTSQGIFMDSVCSALAYLFIPNQAQLSERVADLQATVRTKIPFGYFDQVSSTFNGLIDEDTTSSVITLHASTTYGNFSAVVFDPTAIKAKIPATMRAQIRLAGGLAMWTFFLMWLYDLARGLPSEL